MAKHEIPYTFKQWRKIYHRELGLLGSCVYFEYRQRGKVNWPFARERWTILNRLRRIERNLHACNGDDSWCEAIIEMFKDTG